MHFRPVLLASQVSQSFPKHYMQQFHIDYADPDELERMMQEEGVDTWAQLV